MTVESKRRMLSMFFNSSSPSLSDDSTIHSIHSAASIFDSVRVVVLAG